MNRYATDPDPLLSFNGLLEPRRVSMFYQAGLLVVAIAMLLLPLIYVGLIIALGAAVYWHIVHDWVWVTATKNVRVILIALLFYGGVAGAGVISILFLIKPLFARAKESTTPIVLGEQDQPVLFEFVRKICDLVGSPRPREVQINCLVNASASFRRGVRSFFGNDLVLTIGMPLVAGMTMRQLAGVVAHEFGHFSQGAGMRLSYIIRRINAWFARVVFERDEWDQRLMSWSHTDAWQLRLCVKLAQGAVWVGRTILHGLMWTGHALSCFMSRQMEFDADSYEAQMAGSSEFPLTAKRLRLLNASFQAAMNDALQTFQRGELPEDLPAMVVWREQSLPEATRTKVIELSAHAKTGWSDTHPADSDRDRAALACGAEGIFTVESPAKELFRDFAGLCRIASTHFYESVAGLSLDRIRLVDTSSVVSDRKAADGALDYLKTLYGEGYDLARMIAVPAHTKPSLWPEARRRMHANAESYAKLMERYDATRSLVMKQRIASDLISAGYSLQSPSDFGLTSSSVYEADAQVAKHGMFLNSVTQDMSLFEQAAAERVGAALEWLNRNGEVPRLPQLLAAQRALTELMPSLIQSHRDLEAIKMLFADIQNHSDPNMVLRHARVIVDRLNLLSTRCQAQLANVLHPYSERRETIAQTLQRGESTENEFHDAVIRVSACVDALLPLALRIQGDLCELVLTVEPRMERADLYAFDLPSKPPTPMMQGTPLVLSPDGALPPPTLHSPGSPR